jgi:NADP-dependent 3-hydroxy acid dehydrogenase YdfG
MKNEPRVKKNSKGPLSGKTTIVTGASSGIGRSTAIALAGDGAAVVVSARRKDRLKTLVGQIVAQGGKALAIAADASVTADIDRLLEQTLAWKDGGKNIAPFGTLLEPEAIAEGIRWLLSQPPHVNVSEIMIRPTGQSYP